MIRQAIRKRFRRAMGGGMAGHTTAADPSLRPTMPNPDPSNHLAAMFLDHLNKSFASQRGAAARGYGQDDSLYGRPFPGSTQNIKITNIGWPVAGLLLAVAGIAAWLWKHGELPDLKPSPEPPAVVEPSQPAVTYEPIDLRIKWWVEENGEASAKVEEIKRD